MQPGKHTLMAMLDCIGQNTSDEKTKEQLRKAYQDIKMSDEGENVVYLSAFMQAKVLVRRYGYICLS